MKLIFKAAVVLVIVILLTSSVYVNFFTDEDKDNEPPTIDTITGDTTGTAGKITTIYVTFSDNIGVTEAILYYKTASEESWRSTSIINGSADIVIPSNSKENWQYYVTVNDAANNGPIGDPSTDGSSYYTITVSEDEDDEDPTRYVFIEEGTATWCSNCPEVSDILHELYDPDNPDFYYIALVEDKTSKAHDRLYDDYNIYGFPTVYFDGGYATCCLAPGDENRDKSIFRNKISEATSRESPKVSLIVTAEWNESRKELKTTVTAENKEMETYKGNLKVYVTEINSRWSDWRGTPYHFAFLDYAINKDVTIEENGNITFSEKWDASEAGYSDIYPENLWIVAVLFNAESTMRYSNPRKDGNPFDAHLADNAAGVKVAEGDLPPTIGISSPKRGLRYIFGREGRKTLLRKTIILGRTTIKTNVQADSGIEKVEFSIKGLLRETKEVVTEEPYEWSWDTFAFGKYTITAKVYDKEGRTSTDSIDVIAFILGEKFI